MKKTKALEKVAEAIRSSSDESRVVVLEPADELAHSNLAAVLRHNAEQVWNQSPDVTRYAGVTKNGYWYIHLTKVSKQEPVLLLEDDEDPRGVAFSSHFDAHDVEEVNGVTTQRQRRIGAIIELERTLNYLMASSFKKDKPDPTTRLNAMRLRMKRRIEQLRKANNNVDKG